MMMTASRRPAHLLLLLLAALLISCSASEPEPADTTPAVSGVPMPERVALPEQPIPAENPFTPEKAALGKQLFFDVRLSGNGQMSCETCHLPEMGWTDGKTLSPRFDGSLNTRHTPTLFNAGYYTEGWYWDGRAASLEAQIMAAWRSQMGADPEQIAMTVNGIEGYRTQFEAQMGGPATPDSIVAALATFVRTLTSDDSPWDRYEQGDRTAVSEAAIAGFEVFSREDKANCTLCHLPPLYTDTLFHNTGVGYDSPMPDLGRGRILADRAQQSGTTDPEAERMMGAFKTPTLRSIESTGPYFHDGKTATLEEAVDFMLRGGIENPNRDEKLRPRTITMEEREQLLAFIRSLAPASPPPFERPQLP